MDNAEVEYFDDPSLIEKRKNHRVRKLFLLSIFGVLVLLGTTFASNINLNSSDSVEFGQGVTQLVACDSDGIIFRPRQSFLNNVEQPNFYLVGFELEDVSSNCEDKLFTIKVYEKDNGLLVNPVQPLGLADRFELSFDENGWQTVNQQCGTAIDSVINPNANSVEISFARCYDLGDSNNMNGLISNNYLPITSRTTTFTVETSEAQIVQLETCNDGGEIQSFRFDYISTAFEGWRTNYNLEGTDCAAGGSQTKHYFDLSIFDKFLISLKITNSQLADAEDGIPFMEIISTTGGVSCNLVGVAPQGETVTNNNYPSYYPNSYNSEVFECLLTQSDILSFRSVT